MRNRLAGQRDSAPQSGPFQRAVVGIPFTDRVDHGVVIRKGPIRREIGLISAGPDRACALGSVFNRGIRAQGTEVPGARARARSVGLEGSLSEDRLSIGRRVCSTLAMERLVKLRDTH